MTALTRYARLESPGLWRPDAEAQRRDVHVIFGDASLVISETSGRALTHWSLPAIERLNPGTRPAVFSPDGEGGETLEIADPEMIDAIETVRRTLARARPRAGRLRALGSGLTLAAVLALGVFWLPGALIRQTLDAVPPIKRSEIGAGLLGHIQRVTGPPCRGEAGHAALQDLGRRVIGEGAAGGLVVLPQAGLGALYLPGGLIVLGRDLVERVDDPEILAGHILTAAAAARTRDPLEPLLQRAGVVATFRLFTTGDLPAEVISAHAARLLEGPPKAPPAEVLLSLFADAGVSPLAYAESLDGPPELVAALAAAAPEQEMRAPLIPDSAWVALQNICAE